LLAVRAAGKGADMKMLKVAAAGLLMAIAASGTVLADEATGAATAVGGLIKPLGILVYTLLIVTAGIGLSIRKKPKVMMRWHKIAAFAAIAAATCHALAVILLEKRIIG